MKNYVKPEIEVLSFQTECVMTVDLSAKGGWEIRDSDLDLG